MKLNKLQTKTEESIQEGIFFITRGIYQAISNPRAHEKYSDSVQDADSIIIFIDYVCRQIEQSKQQFTKITFLNRIFDEDFVENEKYGALLVKEIPKNKRFEIFVEVLNQSQDKFEKKLKFFLKPLYEKLTKEEKREVDQIISEKLKETNSNFDNFEEVDLITDDLPF